MLSGIASLLCSQPDGENGSLSTRIISVLAYKSNGVSAQMSDKDSNNQDSIPPETPSQKDLDLSETLDAGGDRNDDGIHFNHRVTQPPKRPEQGTKKGGTDKGREAE